jgi:hypothetical protein
MKNTILILIIFMAAITLQAGPKLEIIGGDTYDWGKQSSTKQTLKAKMVLKNVGDDVLKIYSVNPNCGCTTAPLSKNDIMPGDTAVLDVSLNISTYSGDVKKGIDLKTSDPAAANLHITLKTYVIRPLTLFPNYLNFSSMVVNKETMSKVVLTNSTDLPIKILKVEIYPDNLLVNIKAGDELPPNADFVLEARYLPTVVGRFMANVKLMTNNPDVPELIMNGFGSISEAENSK